MVKLMTVAGKTLDGKELFAICDKYNRTMYQIWDTRSNIEKKYTIKIN